MILFNIVTDFTGFLVGIPGLSLGCCTKFDQLDLFSTDTICFYSEKKILGSRFSSLHELTKRTVT